MVETIKALRKKINLWKEKGNKIAFVPTMGNLHAGHLSLVEIAHKKADIVVVSIFINPLQFGENEDLEHYPKTFFADKDKLDNSKVDLVFFPSIAEIYPCGEEQSLVCVPSNLTGILEGESRSGHFDGVTTVVTKLFNIVQPHIAVFGQKDFQQFKIIEKMVEDLAMPIEIVLGEIARDFDGLALSSRNQYLTSRQRKIAPLLQQVLQSMVKKVKDGNIDFLALEKFAKQQLISGGFDKVDYIKIVNVKTLLPVVLNKNFSKLPGLVILATVRLGKTRLLDNVIFGNNLI